MMPPNSTPDGLRADDRDEFVSLSTGVTLHIRHWPGQGRPFVLLHGLASNCRTWELVADRLAEAGHRVVAVDQRGHGLSEKPPVADGYGFRAVTDDLAALLERLGLAGPVLAGQSWGGNVVLAFGARFPGVAGGLAFVDGGFLNLGGRGPWEEIAEALKPPPLAGTPFVQIRQRIAQTHPDWSEAALAGTLANFERLPDGTVRPWLSLDRHMAILRALWEQDTPARMAQVQEPVLICPARTGDSAWAAAKEIQVAQAASALANARVHWFDETAHDIHQHRPQPLAALFLEAVEDGFWG